MITMTPVEVTPVAMTPIVMTPMVMTPIAVTPIVSRPMIRMQNVSKSYGGRTVLRDVCLDITRGAITAIVGPNGAGKTTLNKAMLGLVHIDAGHIDFDGVDCQGQIAYRERVGYMPQAAHFPESYTASEVLEVLAELRGGARARDNDLIEALEIDRFAQQPVRALSGGQRQRLNAAAAFWFTPDVVLLDEPTAGLDPVASGILKDKMGDVRNAGRSVVITSHVLSEVEQLADVVVFMLDGRVHWHGTIDALCSVTNTSTLERAIATLMVQHAALSAGRVA